MADQRDAIQHVNVSGNEYDRGHQIGSQCSDRLQRSLSAYRRMFETCDINWSEACEKGLACLEYSRELLPEVVTEIEGLAAGSSVDLGSIAALNARTEILPADYLARASHLDPRQLPDNGQLNECTSVAFSKPQDKQPAPSTWLAQNWDWLGIQRQSLLLIHAADQSGQPLYLTAAEAGMLAKIGLNRHGLGITLNILRSAEDGQNTGLPVHLFLRGLLDCRSVKEAIELAGQANFASSSNVLIADASGAIASIEISPSGARVIKTHENQTDSDASDYQVLCHTNHFLHPDLQGTDTGLTGNISTQQRLDKARSVAAKLSDLQSIESLLADTSDGGESVCRFADPALPADAQIETVFAVAMNLGKGELWATQAQPSISAFECYSL